MRGRGVLRLGGRAEGAIVRFRPARGVDAAAQVGYAGLSTFDRALVDVRATRDQWTAGLAVPGNCTFTIRRGDVGKPAGAPSGVHVHHFTSLP